MLSRLKNSVLIKTYIEESQEGPARRYCQLTSRGRKDLQHWDSLHGVIGGLRKAAAGATLIYDRH